MLNKIETLSSKFLIFKVYGGLSSLFEDENFLKTEIKNIKDNDSIVLKDVIITFFENTPMVEIKGNALELNLSTNEIIETNKLWRFRTSNFTFIFEPHIITTQQILNG